MSTQGWVARPRRDRRHRVRRRHFTSVSGVRRGAARRRQLRPGHAPPLEPGSRTTASTAITHLRLDRLRGRFLHDRQHQPRAQGRCRLPCSRPASPHPGIHTSSSTDEPLHRGGFAPTASTMYITASSAPSAAAPSSARFRRRRTLLARTGAPADLLAARIERPHYAVGVAPQGVILGGYVLGGRLPACRLAARHEEPEAGVSQQVRAPAEPARCSRRHVMPADQTASVRPDATAVQRRRHRSSRTPSPPARAAPSSALRAARSSSTG